MYDPSTAPQYVLPKDNVEDEDVASTLKSSHLSEWIHGTGGNQEMHHHHDPFYTDEGDHQRYYSRPGGGYEGIGHDHDGRDVAHGNYGKFNGAWAPIAG